MPSQTTINISLRREAREKLEKRLLTALDRGESKVMTAADWRRIRQTVKERTGARGNPGVRDIEHLF